jgi:hypothetical protein
MAILKKIFRSEITLFEISTIVTKLCRRPANWTVQQYDLRPQKYVFKKDKTTTLFFGMKMIPESFYSLQNAKLCLLLP